MAEISFRQRVADELIRAIEQGTAPWQKPWRPNVIRSAPFNPTSDRAYRGINAWWLEQQGMADPRWLTYRQAEGIGAQVRKGEKGTLVEYWKWTDRVPTVDANGQPVLDANGQQRFHEARLERPKVFHAVVFNASQMDGLEPYKAPTPTFEPVTAAEKLLAGATVPILHDQADRAYYTSLEDRVHLPPVAAFKGAYEYYATALHEIGHSTGHASRFNREFGAFGSEAYAKEELRAEMASFMVSTELGLGHYPERHAPYVESWLKALKDDRNLLFVAARDAEAIRTWIMEPEKRQELTMQHNPAPAPVVAMARATEVERAMPAAQQEFPRKLEEPSLVDRMENYFRPGRIVSGRYGEDTVLEFHRINHIRWEVVVEAAGPMGVGGPRTHATQPHKDALAAWENDNPVPDHMRRERIFLNVPFAERDDVKMAGARWDASAKSWYIPPGEDPARFERWRAAPRPANEKANSINPTLTRDAGEKIFLNVPYAEKNQAKAAGAKWDRGAKSWFVPDGVDPASFQRWRTAQKSEEPKLDPRQEFKDALQAQGLILKEAPVMDGKWHRVAVEDDKAGQLSGSYRGFNDGRPAGQIMNYRTMAHPVKWVATGNQVDPADLGRLRAEAAERAAKQQQDLQAQYAQVGKRAYGIFMNAPPADENHPYLQRKQIPAGELRQDRDGNLLVPMRDERGHLWNLQTIQPDGTKRYMKDGRMAGLMHVMKGKENAPTIVAEGYATAADLRAASGCTTVVAFNAGNLEKVATALKAQAPKAELIIAADDDHKLVAQGQSNTGLVHARQAARAVDGQMIAPPLLPGEILKGLSDYNDIKLERGKGALAGVLAEQIGEAKTQAKQAGLTAPMAQMGM